MVDDDALIINTLSNRFSTREVEVFTAATPEAAKGILGKLTPELVVLDLLLTKEDGSQGIIDYIKGEERLQNVPIVVLTNLDKPELKDILLAQGIRDYIIKGSLDLDQLYERILGYLEPKNSSSK